MTYPILDTTPLEDIHADMHNAFIDAASHYGVIADGTTDNSTAMQSALDDLDQAVGGTIQLPAGTVYCASNLTYTGERLHLRGRGRASTILKMNNGTIGLDFGDGTNNKHYYTLEDMYVTGTGTAPSTALIRFNKCFIVKVSNCSIADSGVGIRSTGGGHHHYIGNVFNYNSASTQKSLQFSGSSQVTISANTHEGFTAGTSTFIEFVNSASNSFAITGNVAKEAHGYFINFQSDADLTDFAIVGNVAVDESVSFVNLPAAQNSVLTDGTIMGNSAHGTNAGSSVGLNLAGVATRVRYASLNNIYNYATLETTSGVVSY